jgi:hypothetical protein
MSHINAAKHVLRYLKSTANRSLIFRKADEPLHLVGSCDADWGASEDRRSITGYGFHLSSKGPTVALSTCEAEYMSLASAVQEGKFLSQLLEDFVKIKFTPVTLPYENFL